MMFLRIICLLLLATPATAAEPVVTVENAWAPATLAGTKTGTIYMTLHNHDTEMHHLVGAMAKVSKHIEVHNMRMEDGVMKMNKVNVVGIKGGGSATFESGGLHIMLIDLEKPLAEGDSFPLTLSFAKNFHIEATVEVKKR